MYHRGAFAEMGITQPFVQENQSRSIKHVVRGLHFQWDPMMAKLMRVIVGAAFLVAVDIRKGSPTLGQWVGVEASAENRRHLWAPASFARGLCALTDEMVVQYLCTGNYNKQAESGIRWNDPAIGIEWPVSDPILSDKDRDAQTLAEWLAQPESDHFIYTEGA
jgi:dTDP-4-dehydrorhamnose 3,5-epimerase